MMSAQAVVGQQEALYELLKLQVQGSPYQAQLAAATLSVLADSPEAMQHMHCLHNVLCCSLDVKTGAVVQQSVSGHGGRFRQMFAWCKAASS